MSRSGTTGTTSAPLLTHHHDALAGAVRLARPGFEVSTLRAGDTDVVQAVFNGMGEQSRMNRFLVPMPRLVRGHREALASADGHRHVALVARAGGSRRPIGIGRYVMTDVRTAEMALAVVDDWHGRGVGAELLRRLAAHARHRGLESLHGAVLTTNQPMLLLLAREFTDVRVRGDRGVLEFETPLGDRGDLAVDGPEHAREQR